MATLASLAIDLTANSAKMLTELRKVNKHLDTFEKKAKAVSKNAKIALSGIITAGTTTLLVDSVLQVSGSFETLQASLETTFGSQKKAELQFKKLTEFASKTPLTIQEVTDASIKMKAFGLDPSIDSMESMINTSVTLGKSLDQFVEAIADAGRGQFERLNEFGIAARKNGESVSFTFQGVTKSVSNSSVDIIQYLNDIGNNQFAGALKKQAETLPGILSTLGGAVDLLAVKFSEKSGLAKFVKESSQAITSLINRISTGRPAIAELKAELDRFQEGGTGSGRNKGEALENNRLERIKEINKQILEIQAESGNIESAQKLLDMIDSSISSVEEKTSGADRFSGRGRNKSENPDFTQLDKLNEERDAYIELIETIEGEKADATIAAQAANDARIAQAKAERQEELGNSVEKLTEKYATEQELLVSKFEEETKLLEQYYSGKEGMEQKHADTLRRIKDKYFLDVNKLYAKGGKDEVKTEKKTFGELIAASAAGSSNLFDITKNLILDKAKVLQQQAILGAYTAGNEQGGPYVGAAYALIAAAASTAIISKISGAGGGGGGGGLPSVPEPGDDDPPIPGLDDAANDEPRNKTVILDITGIDDEALLTKGQVRKIVDQINDEREANVRIVI